MTLRYPKPKDQKRPKREAVKIMRDGREICADTPRGWLEYSRRKQLMLERQGFRCASGKSPECPGKLSILDAVYHHTGGRGAGGFKRDDRISVNGVEQNQALCWRCHDLIHLSGKREANE